MKKKKIEFPKWFPFQFTGQFGSAKITGHTKTGWYWVSKDGVYFAEEDKCRKELTVIKKK